MSFLRYMEFCKNETDMHPQTGETKKHTIVDVYVYPDSVLVWGWGWSNTFRPGEKSLDEIVTMVETMFKEEHFKKTCDESRQFPPAPDLSQLGAAAAQEPAPGEIDEGWER